MTTSAFALPWSAHFNGAAGMLFAASSREEAIRLAEDCSPDLATVDLRMPGESGLTVVRELRALDSTTFILVLTGYGSIPTAMDAVRLGAESLHE